MSIGDEASGGEVARITDLEFRISERAMSKFAVHGIIRRQVDELIGNNPVVATNRKHRAANYLLIGRDSHGRCIAVPITPTDDPTIWRPVTAWYRKPSEAAKLRHA